ncbi:C-type lectin domain family 4 member K-like [Notamacropus eugenii]|uniref:C-type lectin domain family 4 member K-like n=1 Tax=Notamacropus eugenii TaxID=9315 RepID=UPI003B67BC14
MELDGVYENVTPINTSPQAGKGLAQHSYKLGQISNTLANRRSRIIYAALILLVLALAAALSAVTYLYLQLKAVDMTSEVEMWKAHSQRANNSIADLGDQNKILMQRLSEFFTIYKGNMYYFSCATKPWAEAEKICVSKGSHLTSVTSEDEQKFLSEKTNGIDHWNGLNRRKDQKTFSWTDGTLYDDAKTKEFWKAGEPNNDKDNEHCVHFGSKELRSWNDLNCKSSLKFICKWSCPSSGLCNLTLHRH